MLKTLVNIALNWTARGAELRHVRCARCHEVHAEMVEGHFLRIASFTMRRAADGQVVTDGVQTPEEWVCPCGRRAPLEVGELLVNDTMTLCRRRLCRNRWRVPAEVERITCPCCWSDQPGPAAG
ncbi:ferredoxin-thioredoxin reductase catalytic subunit [Nonomuraea thailandensis]|uniref:Ferredoxin-thioredoxin reductase catalytic subunit n=2 Tax=Nonomuraea thailandensis TaxID=1188745 RepID=A0A9X2GVA0_9ACTN|nr:hypothetical protein [Nonomuraea thailandensis]MCP2365751.1 ferredoxin-thioredoxin reductase catalytic subunit [Nonomuraea thailandensis]